jgi:hypothetical protein
MSESTVFPAGLFSSKPGQQHEGERWLGRSAPWLHERLGVPGHSLPGSSAAPPRSIYVRLFEDHWVVASTGRRSVEGRQQALHVAVVLPRNGLWTHFIPAVQALRSAAPASLEEEGQLIVTEDSAREAQRQALDLLLGLAELPPAAEGTLACPGREVAFTELLAMAVLQVHFLSPGGSCVILDGSEPLPYSFPRAEWSMVLAPSARAFEVLEDQLVVVPSRTKEVRGLDVANLRKLKLDRFDRLFGRWSARTDVSDWTYKLDLPLEVLDPATMTGDEWQQRLEMLAVGQRAGAVLDAAARLGAVGKNGRILDLALLPQPAAAADDVAALYLRGIGLTEAELDQLRAGCATG